MSITIPGKRQPESVTKLDAARRQLATAITLWFTGGDAVSTYALSHAAYEVIHNFTKPNRTQDLLFDSRLVRNEYRKQFNGTLRNPANFFKHAQRGKSENPTVEFYPETSEIFIAYSIFALSLIGKEYRDEESIFTMWMLLHRTEWLTPEGRKFFSDHMTVDRINQIQSLNKREFFEGLLRVRQKLINDRIF